MNRTESKLNLIILQEKFDRLLEEFSMQKRKNRIMKELLEEQLMEYVKQFKENERQCIELMVAKKDWKEHAKNGAGLKLMIEETARMLKKYS